MAAKAWLSTNKLFLAGGTAALTAGSAGVGALLNGSRGSSDKGGKGNEEAFSISDAERRESLLTGTFPTMVDTCSTCKADDIKRLYYLLDIAIENLDNEYTKDLNTAKDHWQKIWLPWRDKQSVPTDAAYANTNWQNLKTQYTNWQNKWTQKIDTQVSKVTEESQKSTDREEWEKLRNQDIEFLKNKFSEMFGLEKTLRLRASTES